MNGILQFSRVVSIGRPLLGVEDVSPQERRIPLSGQRRSRWPDRGMRKIVYGFVS